MTRSRPVVAAATRADLGAVADLEAATFPTPWSAADLAAELERPPARLSVARLDADVVGHLLARRVLDEAEILTTAVRPGARRRGVGRALLADLIAWSRAEGVAHLHLDVRRDNVAARGLYAQAGFVEVGVRPGYYHDGVDGVLMRLELVGATAADRPVIEG